MYGTKGNASANCYFFTLTTYLHKPIFESSENVTFLRQAFHHTMSKEPFVLAAISVLPDHLHCIWELSATELKQPSGRWQMITELFQQQCQDNSPLWQEPYLTHLIQDQADYNNHLEYIQLNPIKLGYVDTAKSWPYSRFDQRCFAS